MTILITAGQRHEQKQTAVEALMEQGAVQRRGRERPRLRPRRVVGDKGYRSKHSRSYLRKRGIGVVSPRRMDERRRGPFDKAA